MPKGKKALREIIKGDLLIQLNEVWRKGESYQDNQKGDNIQGTLHCKAVETNLCKLIPDDKKEKELSQTELFVLSAAACLHDIGKVVIDDAKGWKSDHGKRSMEIILKEYDKLGLDKGQAIAVGYVVSVHGDGRLDELPPKLAIGSEEISLIGLAAIFRLADMLDTNYQRVPEILRIIKFPEGDVPSKWKGRPAITGWYLDEKDRIILQAVPKKDEIDSVYTLKAMMNEDLAQISPYLKLYEYPFELGELDLGDVFIKAELKKKAVIKRPFPGMAFYTKDDAKIFKGRDKEIEDLLSIVSNWPITLLIGESGAGKTSLIHAGLFPKLDAMSWRYVCTRPFDNPEENIKKMLWSAFFEGNIDPTMNLLDVMKNAAEKIKPKKLLVVMDQFEDILNCGVKEILDDFCLRLTAVQTGTIIPNLRILISFREDALVKINSRLLKKITGSAYQLPSVELERLTREGATKALLAGLENAHIGLDPRQEKGQKSLIEIILDDIQKGDDRLYPPYIQMVAETLCAKVDPTNPIITIEIYLDQLKGADNIIARYLMERLKEFGSQKDKAERVLAFLTSSTGKKAQKNLKELSRATEIEMDVLKEIVNKMVDLRMVSAASKDEFEIIHDYLGKIVDEELVKEEDRTIKFLEEQLDSFYQNYNVHGTPIMDPIFMVNLYRNRMKIKITDEKYPLILCTCLYKKVGLGWYWLKDLNTSKIVEMKKEHQSHGFIIKEDETISELKHWDEEDRIVLSSATGGILDRIRIHNEFLERFYPGGMDKILELLKSEKRKFRYFALDEFLKIAKPGDLDKIIEVLLDEDYFARDAAIDAFIKIATSDDIDKILEMLHHQFSGVRRASVKALKKFAKLEDAEYLLDLIAEESQGWNDKQQDFFYALRELDKKFYCPYYEEEEK
ncbi:MAG: HD domain-containing protein [Candidatus Aminicenantes bacterium]|nr:HD domain-containing protein [Candidatus Aminicenantes bacterium]